ncbi:hypothetical protein CYY_003793 [Polysphondylium violaceum]|uniref:Carrier domain-containing protein n=1 Tax=Polysphondylium violaceum TaxID=133409 RepID=A0A8J4PWG6_9MYCE|nr:hypothetical protein CYY_003793 [Polysphondylium violaceum]
MIESSEIHCLKCSTPIYYTRDGVYRLQCVECRKLSVCQSCYELDCLYYHIPQSQHIPYTYSKPLLDSYVPIEHSCKSIPLPHEYTREKYLTTEYYKTRGTSIYSVFKNAFNSFPERRCLGYKNPESSIYSWLSYQTVHELSNNLASALSHFISPKEAVGIFSENSIPWYVIDFAITWNRYVLVPIHYTYGSGNTRDVLLNSSASCVAVSKKNFSTIVQCLNESQDTLSVRMVIHIDSDPDQSLVDQLPKNIIFKTYQELIEFGKTNAPLFPQGPREPTDLSNLSYTSGSTGVPKGVMFRDQEYYEWIKPFCIHYPYVVLNHGPMSHAERGFMLQFLTIGAAVGVFTDSYDKMFDNMAILQPHLLHGVPRVFSILYGQYEAEVFEFKKQNPNISDEEIDKVLIPKYRSVPGERVIIAGGGAAPFPANQESFIRKCWPNFYEVYGSTEMSMISKNSRFLDHVDFKLIDVPELGFFTTDKPYPRGEVLLKSPTKAFGYYKNTSDDSFQDDGYFKSGDVVELRDERTIKIIARRKMAFKLSNGEFVSPQTLETNFLSQQFIQHIMIYGDILKTFLVAIVIPSEEAKKKYPDIKNNKEYYSDLNEFFKSVAKKNRLLSYEVPFSSFIDDTEWSIASNHMLATGKYNRSFIQKAYKTEIDKLYSNIDQTQRSLRDPKALDEYLRDLLKIPSDQPIDYSTVSFSQIGGDSLSAVKLSTLLKNININISATSLLNQDVKLSALNEIISSNDSDNISNTTALTTAKSNVDFEKEIELDKDFFELYDRLPLKQVEEKERYNVFLTGCTGFLGAFLLKELLTNTLYDKVYCHLRNKKESEAKQYLKSIFNKSKISFNDCDLDRVIPIIGDLGKPKFGMDVEQFNELADKIDMVIHNGATVNMVFPYPNLKKTNVDSTKDAIRLALTGQRLKKLVYISTIGVFLDRSVEGIDTKINDYTQPSLNVANVNNGYSTSKLVSDMLVRRASKELNIPSMVFRPGTIYCSSETGFDNAIDYVGLIIKAMLKTKTCCTPAGQVGENVSSYANLSPVDWVASSISSLAGHHDFWTNGMDKETNNLVFNMVNNNPIHFREFFDYMMQEYPMTELPYSEWTKVQFKEGEAESSPIYPIKHLFQGKIFPGMFPEQFTCPRTEEYLKRINKLPAQPTDATIVKKNIRYLLSTTN